MLRVTLLFLYPILEAYDSHYHRIQHRKNDATFSILIRKAVLRAKKAYGNVCKLFVVQMKCTPSACEFRPTAIGYSTGRTMQPSAYSFAKRFSGPKRHMGTFASRS
ncbi:hypothetical protein BJ508DRAFT_53965 [Ascobolus immersus RN42]|uniref:Secreted protein n=1 Tax=Ascobolus immersus RN42 TaxID=1160509 RepID=A0A3N4HIN2_ASCIM|nr:hypothetical protein BJ508DRAFT_53965 [Ascobolus immersus RN42]